MLPLRLPADRYRAEQLRRATPSERADFTEPKTPPPPHAALMGTYVPIPGKLVHGAPVFHRVALPAADAHDVARAVGNAAAAAAAAAFSSGALSARRLSPGDVVTMSCGNEAADFGGCPGSHLSFTPGYGPLTVAEVRGGFFTTTRYSTLWAPVTATNFDGAVCACLFLLYFFKLIVTHRDEALASTLSVARALSSRTIKSKPTSSAPLFFFA